MKRPLILIAAFYILALTLSVVSNAIITIIGSLIIIILSIFLYKLYYRKWLLLLPIIFFLAYISMNIALENHYIHIDSIINGKTKCDIIGKIKDYETTNDGYTGIITIKELKIKQKVFHNPIVVKFHFKTKKKIILDQIVKFKGTIYTFKKATNDGQWNEKLYYKIRGIDYRCFSQDIILNNNKTNKILQEIKTFKYNLKDNYNKLLPNKEAGIINAMILGDRSGLDNDVKDIFGKSGILHILAISGLHIMILGFSLFKILKKIINIKVSTIISIIILISYCYLTGSSISTQRAVIMMVIMLLSYLLGKSYDIISAAALSALIVLIKNPLYILDVGFLLSYSAVFGIVYITPYIELIFPKKNRLSKALSTSIAAYLSTLPIITYFFYEIPVYGILVNVLIVPLLYIVVILSILSGLLSFINLILGKLFIGCTFFILKIYEIICMVVMKLPNHTLTIGHNAYKVIVLIYLVIGCIILIYKNRFSYNVCVEKSKEYLYKYLIIFFMIIISTYFIYKKEWSSKLSITFLDVGQGDSIFIQAPNNMTYLIDGGGQKGFLVGENILVPYFKYNAITIIDYMFLTHSDLDHISGLLEIINYDNIKVKHLVIPKTTKHDELFLQLVEKAHNKNIPVIELEAGDYLNNDILTIKCLHPDESTYVEKNNDYSLVLSVLYKTFKTLLSGDIEKQQEMTILDKLSQHQILKSPHHGSKSSSSKAFIKKINPQVIVISSGKNNQYGHPHKEVLLRYKQEGIKVYNTANTGAITIKTNGNDISIITNYK